MGGQTALCRAVGLCVMDISAAGHDRIRCMLQSHWQLHPARSIILLNLYILTAAQRYLQGTCRHGICQTHTVGTPVTDTAACISAMPTWSRLQAKTSRQCPDPSMRCPRVSYHWQAFLNCFMSPFSKSCTHPELMLARLLIANGCLMLH